MTAETERLGFASGLRSIPCQDVGAGSRAVAQIVIEGLPAEVTCRVVGVSVSGFYMWRHRKPSARAVRHAMVAEVIRQVHDEATQKAS